MDDTQVLGAPTTRYYGFPCLSSAKGIIEVVISGYCDLHREPILVKPSGHVSGQVMFVLVRLPESSWPCSREKGNVGVMVRTVRRYTSYIVKEMLEDPNTIRIALGSTESNVKITGRPTKG